MSATSRQSSAGGIGRTSLDPACRRTTSAHGPLASAVPPCVVDVVLAGATIASFANRLARDVARRALVPPNGRVPRRCRSHGSPGFVHCGAAKASQKIGPSSASRGDAPQDPSSPLVAAAALTLEPRAKQAPRRTPGRWGPTHGYQHDRPSLLQAPSLGGSSIHRE